MRLDALVVAAGIAIGMAAGGFWVACLLSQQVGVILLWAASLLAGCVAYLDSRWQ